MDKELVQRAIKVAKENKDNFSVGLLQKEFKIGNIACARLIDYLEQLDIVAPYDANCKGRKVLI